MKLEVVIHNFVLTAQSQFEEMIEVDSGVSTKFMRSPVDEPTIASTTLLEKHRRPTLDHV